MDFVLSTGYMPVRTGAFAKIGENSFKSDAFKNLYAALTKTVATCTFVREPNFDGYYSKVRTLYDEIRKIQKNLASLYAAGGTTEQIVAEMKAALYNVA